MTAPIEQLLSELELLFRDIKSNAAFLVDDLYLIIVSTFMDILCFRFFSCEQ